MPDPKFLPDHSVLWWLIKITCGLVLVGAIVARFLFNAVSDFSSVIWLAQLLVIVGGLSSLFHYRILKADNLKVGNKDISAPQQLTVTKGLFRWVRHPMYLSDLLSYSGLYLLGSNLLMLPVLLLGYVALFRQAQAEDHAMAQRFGHEYTRWQATTKLILPAIY